MSKEKIKLIGRVVSGQDGFGVRIKSGREEFYLTTSKHHELLKVGERWKITFEKMVIKP